MSLIQNCLFKKNKKPSGLANPVKISESHIFLVPNNPKNLDYIKLTELNTNHQVIPESISQDSIGGVSSTVNETRHLEGNQDDPYATKCTTPRRTRMRTASDLPTAFNSVNHTPISSSRNHNEDSQGVISPYNDHRGSYSNRKRSSIDETEFEYADEDHSIDSGENNKTKSNKTKTEDFRTKFRTELCKFYEINGTCKFGDNCAYAHGRSNLRSKLNQSNSYRTKKCKQFFQTGFCCYGYRCQFSHSIKNESKKSVKTFSYTESISLLSKGEELDQIKTKLKRPRLSIFEEITHVPSKHTNSSFIDDIKALKVNLDISIDHETSRMRILSL